MLFNKLSVARLVALKMAVLGLLLGVAQTVTMSRAVADDTLSSVHITNQTGVPVTFHYSADGGNTWQHLGQVRPNNTGAFTIDSTGRSIHVYSEHPDGSKSVATPLHPRTTPGGNHHYQWYYSPNN